MSVFGGFVELRHQSVTDGLGYEIYGRFKTLQHILILTWKGNEALFNLSELNQKKVLQKTEISLKRCAPE